MNEESKLNKLILKGAYAVTIVLIIAVIALLILKYEVEGEQNMPFKLSSVLILSNAEGYQEKQSQEYRWDTEIYQNNDIYLNIIIQDPIKVLWFHLIYVAFLKKFS